MLLPSVRKEDGLAFVYLLLAPIVIGPFISSILSPNLSDDTVNGYVEQGFEPVLEAFRRNFGEGLEREGASVAVYHRGRRVVHLWGGWADKESGRRWQRNTRGVLFSATKAVSALVMAVLVDRGLVRYEDRVTEFWPEYGRHGKENTTIEHILTHMAGIPYLEDDVHRNDIVDFDRLMHKMQEAKPAWVPGSGSGYHAVTFGFLLDAIVRRVDEKGRSLAEFFKEEIAQPNALDVSIGASLSSVPWVARVTQPSLWEFFRDTVKDPRLLAMFAIMYARPDGIVQRIRESPSWLTINYDTVAVNDPEILALPLGAVTGVATADSLARMFSMTLDGSMVSNSTLEMLLEPTLNTWHLEKVTLYPVAKGRGFFYEKNPLISGAYTFGHPGYGGQFVQVDPSNQLVIAYLANGLKTGTGELCTTYMRLMRETYNVIRDRAYL